MTTGLLLSKPFSDRKPSDDAEIFAFAVERGTRELLWRAELQRNDPDNFVEISILERIPARDAGDVCAVCGEIVTWVDHLPATTAGGPVRCFKNVVAIESATSVEIDDIFRRV